MTGQQIGYIRVSSFDQHPEQQLDGMALDRSFIDKVSGKDVDRPQLEALMTFVRRGDTVVVHSMDRLARNLDDLRRVVQCLTARGVRIQFLKEHLTFTGDDSPMAHLMLSVMGAFAEFERALIRERQREGIALAKQRGARGRAGAYRRRDALRCLGTQERALPGGCESQPSRAFSCLLPSSCPLHTAFRSMASNTWKGTGPSAKLRSGGERDDSIRTLEHEAQRPCIFRHVQSTCQAVPCLEWKVIATIARMNTLPTMRTSVNMFCLLGSV